MRESQPAVFAASDFVSQLCEREPQLLAELIESGDLLTRYAADALAARVPAGLNLPRALHGAHGGDGAPAPSTADDQIPPDAHEQFASGASLVPVLSEPDAIAALRRWRKREMVRIAWRDIAGWAALNETLRDTSDFADVAISVAHDYALQSLVTRYGQPRSAEGEVQSLVIVGMGKLGGGELNFSSDIDLVFLFSEHGETDGARSVANEEFFTRLGQATIRLLETPTHEGIVFRVDMRLRPFGDSGPLVASFASFEDYLQRHGREWERYAWVKARPITNADRYVELYTNAVRPFVYRRYLDFGVIESLRAMKSLIEREVQRRELADDVKLGPGGIREIEFIVQAFQLIRGGQDKRLQTPSLMKTLPLLDGSKLLPSNVVADLGAAYAFLRRLENRLQMLADRQAHQLPRDYVSRERIALAMGATSWPHMLREFAGHRESVSRHFRSVIFGGERTDPRAVTVDLESLWDTNAERAALVASLKRAGFGESAEEAARLLLDLRTSALVRKLDELSRKRLQALLPLLMTNIAHSREPLPVLRRTLRMLEAIGQRSAYFALLHESTTARERLVELCARGDFLADQLAAYPILLDELIDERLLEDLPNRADLERDLEMRMALVEDEDPERQVEALRHFQRAAIFRVAVLDLMGRLPLMNVSDRLTDIAELIVERAMDLGWKQMTAQFGTPMCGEGGERRPVRVCAVGYGKLGGMELGYSSDLDLVFLHDSTGEQQETDHERAVDNQVFFVRLAQRIVHLLTMHSAAGRLYEVDVRLRPSGKGGLLVTQIRAFAEYQQKEAWTWEHQALLHARSVAGSAELREEFESIRLDVLQHHVRRDSLKDEVRNMRERMRRELSKAKAGEFDIKQNAGGVADIEFLAQYWALKWADRYSALVIFSDTIRQLESVASGNLVPQEKVDVLTAAYRAYRASTHHAFLEGRAPIVSAELFTTERAAVSAVWNEAMQV